MTLSIVLGAGLSAAFVYAATRGRRLGLGRRPALAVLALAAWLTAALALATSVEPGIDWPVRFGRPWGTLLGLGAVLFIVDRLIGSPPRMNVWRRRLVDVTLPAAALSAALAFSEVEGGAAMNRLSVIVAVDRSRSIDLVEKAESRIQAELTAAETSMGPRDRLGIVVFGADAALEEPLRERTTLRATGRATVGRDATDIGAAIRRALAEVPADSAARIALLTDGVSTRGDALGSAAAAAIAGVPVDTVLLEQSKLANVRVEALRLPIRADQGEMMRLGIVTTSTEDADVLVRILRDGELIRRAEGRIAKGEDVLTLRQPADSTGLHLYEVQVTTRDGDADHVPDDNAASAFVRVEGRARALVLDANDTEAEPMERALANAGFDVVVATAPSAPADLAALATFDLVVLADVPARDLGPDQLDAIAAYVETLGGGLVLLGGPQSMGPGGYGKTPIERVSPVSFDLRQSRRRASLAEIIVIDYSGSMAAEAGRQTKLELANEAAVRSAELLGEGDRLGVVHVDTEARWCVPVGPATAPNIAERIRKVGPGGGGIFLDLALAEAYRALRAEKTHLKHVIVFADGSDAEERSQAPRLTREALASGITTSIVALGRGSDVPDLERLSQMGQGRFYLIEDASRLPAVFAQETIAATRSAIHETDFVPSVRMRERVLEGVDFGAAPPLAGYVVTIAKSRATVALEGPEADPILAAWTVGVGRAAAFTSDFKGRWGMAWASWPGASQLFAQLARHTARRADDPRLKLEAETREGSLRLIASAVDGDGRSDSFRSLDARVGGPDGFERTVVLEPTGPGRYEANVDLSRYGAYVASIVDRETDHVIATTGAVLRRGDEMRPAGSDRIALERIAALSGGVPRETLAGIFANRPDTRRHFDSWSGYLVLLSACLFFSSIVARRLAIPDALVHGLATASGALLRIRTRPRRRRRSLDPPSTTDALVAAKLSRRRDRSSASEIPPIHVKPPPTAETGDPEAKKPEQPTAAEILLARRRQRK